MKSGTLKTTAKVLILACFTVFVVLPVLISSSTAIRQWRFVRFSWRGKIYYAQVAEACDEVMAKADPDKPELRGDRLLSLPPVLRDLRPVYVTVYSNVMMMRDDGGLLSHQIIWGPDSANESLWHLRIRSGDSRDSRIIFSKQRPKVANSASGVGVGTHFFHIEPLRPVATNSTR